MRQSIASLVSAAIACSLLLSCTQTNEPDVGQLEADARTATDKGEYEKAEELLQVVVKHAEGSSNAFELPNACEELGLVYVKEGRHAEAQKLFQKALDKLLGLKSQPNNELDVQEHIQEGILRLQLHMAEALSQTKKNDEAEKLFQHVLKAVDEDTHLSHGIRAMAIDSYQSFQERTGHKEAARALDERVEFETSLPEGHVEDYGLAKRALRRGDIAQAAKLFDGALMRTPKGNDKELCRNLVWLSSCLVLQEKLDEAEKRLREVEGQLTLPEAKAEVRVLSAYVLELQGKHKEALTIFHDSVGDSDTLRGCDVLLEVYASSKRVNEEEAFRNWFVDCLCTIDSNKADAGALLVDFANKHIANPAQLRAYYERAFAVTSKIPTTKPSLRAAIAFGLSTTDGEAGDLQKALAYGEQAVSDLHGVNLELQARMYRTTGVWAERLSQFRKAAEYMKKASALEKDPRNRAADFSRIGNNLVWAHDFKGSTFWYRRAVDDARKLDDPVVLCSALTAYAEGLITCKEFDKAEQALKEAEALNTKDLKTPDLQFLVLQAKMHSLNALKRYDQADAVADQALASIQHAKPTPRNVYTFLTEYASIKMTRKQFEQAIGLYDRALSISTEAGINKYAVSDLHFLKSRCYFSLRQFDQAHDSALKSMELAKGNPPRELRNCKWLVAYARAANDSALEKEYAAKVVDMEINSDSAENSKKDARSRVEDLIEKGDKSRVAHDYTTSTLLFERAVDEARKLKAPPAILCAALSGYAGALVSSKEYDKAMTALDEAQALNWKDPSVPALPFRLRYAQMRALTALKQYDKADVAAEQALNSIQKAKQTAKDTALFYWDCGSTKFIENKYDQALSLCDRELAICKDAGMNDLLVSDIFYRKARCNYSLNQMDEAEKNLLRSNELAKENPPRQLRNYKWLVIWAQKTKNAAAESQYTARVAELEKASKN